MTQFSEPWHSGSPNANDPENYQVRLRWKSGSSPDGGGPAVNVWHRLDSQSIWELSVTRTTSGAQFRKVAEWYVDVRRNPIGGSPEPAITKLVDLEASVEPLS